MIDLPNPAHELCSRLSRLQDQVEAGDPPLTDELHLLQTLASHCALYVEQLHGLVQTAALLTRSLDLHTRLAQIIETVLAAAGADNGYVLRYEADHARITVIAARSRTPATSHSRESFPLPLIQYVYRQGKAVLALHDADSPEIPPRLKDRADHLNWILCLPLLIETDTIGVLYLDRVTITNLHETILPLMQAYAHQTTAILIQEPGFAAFSTTTSAAGFAASYRVQTANQHLVNPLSERELEILQLIAAGLSNSRIAAQLVISVSTVKKHINHLYLKLDITNRTEAILKATELHLI